MQDYAIRERFLFVEELANIVIYILVLKWD